MLFEQQLELVLQKAAVSVFGTIELKPLLLQKSSNLKFGDFQTNFAMVNSKIVGGNPRDIAVRLIAAIDENALIEKCEIAGPGFINIFIRTSAIENFLKNMSVEKQDFSFLNRKGDIIIDYSSPNIAKQMHIGHLRSTVIGDSIKRMYNFLGYHTIADNHIGDWGTQFGKLIVAYHKWIDRENYERSPIEELERLYVKYSQTVESEPELEIQARFELKKLQEGDGYNTNLWKEFIKISLQEYGKVYSRLGISFDTFYGESFYNDKMPHVIELLLEKKIASMDDGTTIVFFEGDELPPCIVRKKDGAFLYATSDLACIDFRRKAYDVNRMVYVTDDRQQNHFRQFFKIAELLGWNEQKEHVYFGIMKFSDGIFSSRKGNVIKLMDLLDESVKRARDIIEEKNPTLPPEEKDSIAAVVGTGAIKYFDLSQNKTSNIIFDWEKVLSFEGNTSPYIQYTYARIQSITRKSGLSREEIQTAKVIFDEQIERDIAIQLLYFYQEVIRASESYKPNIIADFIYELAKKINSLYNASPVLTAEESIKRSKLFILNSACEVLAQGLELLGIGVLERM
ncbi:MAG: arginine--tRNA ligase [Fusobacteria bacterium]|nr:arginine--tRNA ligase [Fusobacteriota bacterium]